MCSSHVVVHCSKLSAMAARQDVHVADFFQKCDVFGTGVLLSSIFYDVVRVSVSVRTGT